MSEIIEHAAQENLPPARAQAGTSLPVEPSLAAASPTPMDMLASALKSGVDPATLEKLMDLADRHTATEARKAFVVALNEFKRNPPEILKNKSVAFGTGKAAYRHASLDNVSGVIGKGLSAVGISHRWDTEQLEGGLIRVTCVLTHALGHSERTPLQAMPDNSGSKNSIQAVGSTVSYLQRYTLLAATGMAVADGSDDDGRQGKKMSEGMVADFEAAIESLADMAGADKLWQQIAQATTAAGDVPTHGHLQGLMLAKRKALKAGK